MFDFQEWAAWMWLLLLADAADDVHMWLTLMLGADPENLANPLLMLMVMLMLIHFQFSPRPTECARSEA